MIIVNKKPGIRQNPWLYAMLLPAFVFIVLFSYAPLFGWMIAFQRYSPVTGFLGSPWVGLDNFKYFFSSSSDFLYTIVNTVVINMGSICINLTMSFIFAILISDLRPKGLKKAMQTTPLFPYFIGWTVVYSLINVFFSPSTGVVNHLLKSWGLIEQNLNILGNPKYSWGLMFGINLWKYLGYNTIMFTAAITSIDQEQFEAAAIDGAGWLARVWYILRPNMLATFVSLLIINIGTVFTSDLGQFMLFTNSTNWSKMEVLDMYIYNHGLKQGDFSYGTAVGIIKSFVGIAMVYFTNFVSKKTLNQSIM